jgi:RND family efflux transporter MFP subunit
MMRLRILASTLFLLALVSTGCDREAAASGGRGAEKKGAARPVKTAQVQERLLERSVIALGSFAALDQAIVSTKVSGRLQSLEVDLGSEVKEGQLIGRIQPRDYELRVLQAEAVLAVARARVGLPLTGTNDMVDAEEGSMVKEARAVREESRRVRERAEKLLDDALIPQSEFETADSNFQVASNRYQDALEEMRQRHAVVGQRRIDLEIARQQLMDTRIVAPFSGRIQDRRANAGEFVSEGSPVVTLVRMDPLRLRLEVAERDAPKIEIGQTVRIRVEGDNKLRDARVERISPAITERNRMLMIEANVPNDGALHPGLFAQAAIVVSNSTPALVVPTNAVVTFAGLEKVFVVKDDKAQERLVVTGNRGADWVELVSGVIGTDRVVIDPGSLQHEQAIKVQN